MSSEEVFGKIHSLYAPYNSQDYCLMEALKGRALGVSSTSERLVILKPWMSCAFVGNDKSCTRALILLADEPELVDLRPLLYQFSNYIEDFFIYFRTMKCFERNFDIWSSQAKTIETEARAREAEERARKVQAEWEAGLMERFGLSLDELGERLERLARCEHMVEVERMAKCWEKCG